MKLITPTKDTDSKTAVETATAKVSAAQAALDQVQGRAAALNLEASEKRSHIQRLDIEGREVLDRIAYGLPPNGRPVSEIKDERRGIETELHELDELLSDLRPVVNDATNNLSSQLAEAQAEQRHEETAELEAEMAAHREKLHGIFRELENEWANHQALLDRHQRLIGRRLDYLDVARVEIQNPAFSFAVDPSGRRIKMPILGKPGNI
jgi:DNA repair exonuclease SbcCD ATPase subunit